MVKREALIDSVLNILSPETIETARSLDELANGVQFRGGDQVAVVTLGVSLNADFLQQAAGIGSNFSIFHHALDLRVHQGLYPEYTQARLRAIIGNNFTILGFHAALDIHPVLGNNAQILTHLGAQISGTLHDGWGLVGKFDRPLDREALVQAAQKLCRHDVLAFLAGPQKVKTIGVCSGAAKPYPEHIEEMKAKGVELYLSGETSESTPYKMLESGISYLVCGHYATEVFGVQALGEEIQKEYKGKLNVKFIDVPNPV